ncbi:MAG TPA: hypothetical protein VI072_35230 [Polyangiaceae bacterium]
MRILKLVTFVLLTGLAAGGCGKQKTPAAQRTTTTPAAPVQHENPTEVAKSSAPASSATAANPSAASWTLVDDRSQVCMVNNQFMGRAQIPIAVNGKTYYGCCEMCKGRLGNDASARSATDPLTQKPVDKAVAVIAKRPDGAVAYFESEQTFAAYTKN